MIIWLLLGLCFIVFPAFRKVAGILFLLVLAVLLFGGCPQG